MVSRLQNLIGVVFGFRFVRLDAIYLILGLCLCVLYLFPSLTGRASLESAELQYRYYPWSYQRPADLDENTVTNTILMDVPTYVTPTLFVIREAYRNGELPLWNPYFRSGQPLLGHGQSAPFALTNIPVWMLPWPLGLAWSALFRLVVMFVGGYMLGRCFQLSPAVSLYLGICFLFTPAFAGWFQHPNGNVYLYIPWMLLGVERLLRADKIAEVACGFWILVLSQGFMMLAGHHHSSFNVNVLCYTYFAMRALTLGIRLYWRVFLVGTVAFALGGLLAAVGIFPFLEFLKYSADFTERSSNTAAVLGPISNQLVLLWNPFAMGYHFHYLYRSPSEYLDGYRGNVNWCEDQIYLGIVPLALIFIGVVISLLRRHRPNFSLVFSLLACVALGVSVSLNVPYINALVCSFPPFSFNANNRATAVFSVPVIIGSAFCLQYLYTQAGCAKKYLKALSILLGLFTVLILLFFISGYHPLDFSYRPMYLAVLALVITTILCGWGLVPKLRELVLLAMVTLVTVDYYGVWRGFHPQFPREWSQLTEKRGPLYGHSLMKSLSVPRVAHDIHSPTNMLALFLVADTHSYGAPRFLRHDLYYRQSTGNDESLIGEQRLAEPRVINSLIRSAPNFIVTLYNGDQYFDQHFQRIATQHPFNLYMSRGTVSMAQFHHRDGVALASDLDEAFALVNDNLGSPTEQVVLESGHSRPPSGADFTPISLPLKRNGLNRLSILVPSGASLEEGYIVVRESYDPGWKAMVDGSPADVLPAQVKFMAIKVPADARRIEFSYKPAGFRLGFVVSLLSLVVATLATFVLLKRYRPAS